MGGRSSAELLRIIAETLGVEVETLAASGWDRPALDADADPSVFDRKILLFRMVRAFQALPDAASRLRAVQFVEALMAPPLKAD